MGLFMKRQASCFARRPLAHAAQPWLPRPHRCGPHPSPASPQGLDRVPGGPSNDDCEGLPLRSVRVLQQRHEITGGSPVEVERPAVALGCDRLIRFGLAMPVVSGLIAMALLV